jgi:hypothetical protein
MRLLKEELGHTTERFLVCDHPDSPTWPYTPDETAALKGWKKWEFIGPVFRQLSPANLREVRERYSLADGQRVYVFTMGGGGTRSEQDTDVADFLERGTRIAQSLRSADPECRLIFVRGPFFPTDVGLPVLFESVGVEQYVPELLASSDGAVIRPGFNTLWECLRANVPFVPISGTTYREPVEERLGRLEQFGLTGADCLELWGRESWRSDFVERGRRVTGRWTGMPEPDVVRRILEPPEGYRPVWASAASAAPLFGAKLEGGVSPEVVGELLRNVVGEKRLLIRLDDIVALDEPVLWLLEVFRRRRLFASLEVVPYLSNLSDEDLDAVDAEALLEVGQHGYAHIPRFDEKGRKGEFWPRSEAELRLAAQQIAAGFSKLSAAFPRRFRGGYSPPFDGMPAWGDPVWLEAGVRYLSLMRADAPSSRTPTIRLRTDLWNWKENRPRPALAVVREVAADMSEHGYAGIVIHPRLLCNQSERVRFTKLLDALIGAGATTLAHSALAAEAHASDV